MGAAVRLTVSTLNVAPWRVATALAITETISWGIMVYSFPVFLRAMESDFAASRIAVTGALSAALAISALVSVPVGRWLDRYGARILMTTGSALAGALLLLWSRVDNLFGLYMVWSMMGLAMAMTLYEPAFAAVVRAFRQDRDRALLTVTLAAEFASTIFMPVAAWLLGQFGWRVAVAGGRVGGAGVEQSPNQLAHQYRSNGCR